MSDGCKPLSAGIWNGNSRWEGQGGQVMRFTVNNANVLGTTITIASSRGESHSSIIGPMGSVDLEFSVFGEEPMYWSFDISTDSDAFIVSWTLCSTWIPGDPPNR